MTTDHGATVKKGGVVTWLDVTTDHVPPNGFIWNVLGCLLFPVVNGTAQPVSVIGNEKLVVCNDHECILQEHYGYYHTYIIICTQVISFNTVILTINNICTCTTKVQLNGTIPSHKLFKEQQT